MISKLKLTGKPACAPSACFRIKAAYKTKGYLIQCSKIQYNNTLTAHAINVVQHSTVQYNETHFDKKACNVF